MGVWPSGKGNCLLSSRPKVRILPPSYASVAYGLEPPPYKGQDRVQVTAEVPARLAQLEAGNGFKLHQVSVRTRGRVLVKEFTFLPLCYNEDELSDEWVVAT